MCRGKLIGVPMSWGVRKRARSSRGWSVDGATQAVIKHYQKSNMKLDRFINRPVLSTVISIVIVILGTLGLISLPITQYPDIAPPTVQVSTTYTGANAQTVLNSVIAPLEESINGVENMDYMSSTATNTGSATIQITFKQGTDPDMAAVNVQNRVAKAQGLLPAEVTKVGVITQKRQSSMLVIFSISTPLENMMRSS